MGQQEGLVPQTPRAKMQKKERRGSNELSQRMSMLERIPWLTFLAEWPVSSAIMEALSARVAMQPMQVEQECSGSSRPREMHLVSHSSSSNRRPLAAVVARAQMSILME